MFEVRGPVLAAVITTDLRAGVTVVRVSVLMAQGTHRPGGPASTVPWEFDTSGTSSCIQLTTHTPRQVA